MGLITQGCCASVFLANSRYFLNSTIAHDGRVSCTHAFEMKVIKYPLSDFSIAELRLCPNVKPYSFQSSSRSTGKIIPNEKVDVRANTLSIAV